MQHRKACLEIVKASATPLAQEFDFFHELIAHEEVARIGCPGFQDGIGAGMIIGLPPVIHFGRPELSAKVCGVRYDLKRAQPLHALHETSIVYVVHHH